MWNATDYVTVDSIDCGVVLILSDDRVDMDVKKNQQSIPVNTTEPTDLHEAMAHVV